jgi:HAD superfamily hydrolase (TIGR01459 family)
MSARAAGTPPVITRARELLAGYDVVFCDVWGVLHDGAKAYPAAGEALARFRERGGFVLLLSNAPVPAASVARLLDRRGVRRDAWDTILASGDLTRQHVGERGYQRLHHIGPDRDLALFAELAIRRVALEDAEAVLCTGLVDDAGETGESYRPLLVQARARGLPLVCANPDLVVDVGGTLLPCAGLLGALYEELGGEVFWAGKPHAVAYETARRQVEQRLGRPVPLARILAIGDAPRTDIAGAVGFGIDALFVAHGIHREDVMPGGTLDEERLARLLADAPGRLAAVMAGLAW